MADSISKTRGLVSELTHLVPIRRGLVPQPEWGALGLAPSSFANRLGASLRAFDEREARGFPSVIRLFRQIHSAKWAILDGGTRLLLSVVFDGDWNDYMSALARDVPALLHLIFANTVGWSPEFATSAPDQRREALMKFIRESQIDVNFLYVHHRDLTVRDIDKLTSEPSTTAADVDFTRELGSLEARRALFLEEYEKGPPPGRLELAKRDFRAVFEPRYPNAAFELAYREAFGELAAAQGGSR